MNIDLLKQIAELMAKHQLDSVEFGGLKVTKQYHSFPIDPKKEVAQPTEEELLFWSAEK